MHQGYISEEGILFTRHYGIYKSAEIIVAMKNVLKGNSLAGQLKGVCFDVSAVTAASLDDTDRAYGAIAARDVTSYGLELGSLTVVRVHDPENVAVNEILYERHARITSPICGLEFGLSVFGMSAALKALDLPADYRIAYPQ